MAEQISISIPQPIYRRVRKLARLRNRPVDDVLIEVLDQALPPDNKPAVAEAEAAVEREMQAYLYDAAYNPAMPVVDIEIGQAMAEPSLAIGCVESFVRKPQRSGKRRRNRRRRLLK